MNEGSLVVVPVGLALVALALSVRLRALGLRWGWHQAWDLLLSGGWSDALQLLLVFGLTYRATDRLLPAVSAGLVLALTPALVCCSASVQRNALASLLQTLVMLVVLRVAAPSTGSMQAMLGGDASPVLGVLGALLVGFLAYVDRSTASAFVLSAVALLVLQGDLRLVGFAVLGGVMGVLIAAERSARVKARVMLLFGQSQTRSVMGQGSASEDLRWPALGVRLVGENPFALLVLVTPFADTPWAMWMYWWTLASVALAFLTTFVRPFQVLGPGVRYIRISVFPSAYVLAMNVDKQQGGGGPQSALLLYAPLLLVASLAYAYRVMPLPSTLPSPAEAIKATLSFARSHCRSALALLVGGMLVVLALAQVEHAIGAVIQREEVMYGEAIIYDHAARLVRGAPLYQTLGQAPYSVAAYTPVYYWIAAGLQSALGPGFGPGRVVSLVAGLVAAALVADLARRRARTAWAGLFAAAMFLALGFPTQGPGLEYPWFAFYKEDMLGVTLALGAIAVLDHGASPKRVVLAAVLAALAVLTKQTLAAAGLAGFVWLAFRQLRMAALFAATAAALVVGVSAVMALTTPAFVSNVLAVASRSDPLDDYVLRTNLRTLLVYQAAPLAITAVYLVARLRDWRKAMGDIMVPYALASIVPLVGLAKIGSSYNYWIDLAAICAIVTTHAIWRGLDWTAMRLGPASLRRVEAVTPAVLLLILGTHLVVFVRGVQPSLDVLGILPAEQQRSVRQEADFQWVIDRVRTEPKEVLSESLDVVALAGRPMLAEPIIYTMMVNDDQWSDGPLARRICAGDVGLVILKGPLEGGSEVDRYMRSALWPPHVLEALRETMKLETTKAQFFVYSLGGRVTGPAGLRSAPTVCSAA